VSRPPWLDPSPEAPFPPVSKALTQPNGLLAVGGDLSVARLLSAYRSGIFPWYMPGEPLLWWSPDPRCVFGTHRMHVPRRLNRWLGRSGWSVTADRAYDEVIDGCAAPRRNSGGTWISSEMRAAYLELHYRGYAHSIEARDGDRLVGGLYGVALGRMFFAESMFSVETNGSKVALLMLAALLREWSWPMIDAQLPSAHLHTLGAVVMRRAAFVRAIETLVHADGLPGSWRERVGVRPVAPLAQAD
jgi:leucyl/phenylalanyl-tRNA--protein transferase